VNERPEDVEVGALKLAGNEKEGVKKILLELMGDEKARAAMRVAEDIAWRFELRDRPRDWSI
jgi:UDP-N-acetylglucosamine 2-epimerase